MRNKGCVKPFQKGRLELDSSLISYCDTPSTARVRQLRLRVVPVKFIQVVVSACHVSPLAWHIYVDKTSFMILEKFFCPVVNKEVEQFIRAYTHCQL